MHYCSVSVRTYQVGSIYTSLNMIPHPAPPLNLSRRDDSSPNSTAGPLIGAIFGIAAGVFIVSLICLRVRTGMKENHSYRRPNTSIPLRPPTSNANFSNPRPGRGGSRRPGRNNTRGPRRPNVNGVYELPIMHSPVPGLVPPPPTVASDGANSGGFPFGPGIYPPGTWVDRN